MKGYLTSYAGLFETHPSGAPRITSTEIPLIQRDYAQGRPGASVEEIRIGFLDVLLDAIAGGEPVGLDFVYGKVHGGILHPLDGQQRLTTLFLLHWYLASKANLLDPEAAWTRFSYATRPSARLFCRRLVAHALPEGQQKPSEWITDQEWYLHVWENDPTIQSMLVMIDAIRDRVRQLHPDLDTHTAWDRLTNSESPVISFYLLPLSDMESDEDLYIKMNSRGKPLTEFESFKARFEQDIKHSDRADEFAHNIDGKWSDLLWPIHGGDNIVDDEFIRYIDFITEICELREGRVVTERLGPRARAVFGAESGWAHEHLDFLFEAFDTWAKHGQRPGGLRQDPGHLTSRRGGLRLAEGLPVRCHKHEPVRAMLSLVRQSTTGRPTIHTPTESATVRSPPASDSGNGGLHPPDARSPEPHRRFRGRGAPPQHAHAAEGCGGDHRQR